VVLSAPIDDDERVMDIDHVVLWVEDVRRALDFYTNVVGLLPVRRDEYLAGSAPFPSVRVSERSILDLMPAEAAPVVAQFSGEKTPTAAGRPINHVCLAMDPGELDALAARLASAGVETRSAGNPSFGARGNTTRWFYFQDPDGNVLEARAYAAG
jgi:catechol 2,3-dioxygenase-like lactoylglutathione lyase family enzyme